MHFTPTYASWLHQVEFWFNRITQQALRRRTFRTVKELIEKIDQYAETPTIARTHSSGRPWRIRFSLKFSAYANVFPGRYNSSPMRDMTSPHRYFR
jgi:hypothetical protein